MVQTELNNLEYLLLLGLVLLGLFFIYTVYRFMTVKINIDYNKLPKKTPIDRKKHSISYGFPHIFLKPGYVFRRLLNLFYNILAKRLPLSNLRVLMHRCRGTTIGRKVIMSPNVSIDSSFPHLVFIGNNVAIGHNTIIIAHSMPAGTFNNIMETYTAPVIIEDNSWIGINVIIFPGVTVGKGALVIAGSVVDSDVVPYTVVRGNPAKQVAKFPRNKRSN